MEEQPAILEGQPCPFCGKNTLTLMEAEREIPYFGKIYIFSMDCSSCKYHKADVELADKGEPLRYSIEVSSEEDLSIRVVRSSTATIKIPHIITIEPGTAANGYITNVEGILKRVKHQLEVAREEAEDKSAKDKAKRMIKKLNKVLWGEDKLKLVIEDPNGNSAIVSDKAEVKKLKA
jgi:zinc finger protein